MGALSYEEDSYLPDCTVGEEESPGYDSGQDLGRVGATDPSLDDDGRNLLRLAAGEEIEELLHGERSLAELRVVKPLGLCKISACTDATFRLLRRG